MGLSVAIVGLAPLGCGATLASPDWALWQSSRRISRFLRAVPHGQAESRFPPKANGAASVKELLARLDGVADENIGAGSAVAYCWELSKLRSTWPTTTGAAFESAVHRVLTSVRRWASSGHLDPKSLSRAMTAAAYLKSVYPPVSDLASTCAGAFVPVARGAAVEDLVNIAWALAKHGSVDGSVFDCVADHSVSSLRALRPLDLVKLAWAFAATSVIKTELIRQISLEVHGRREKLTPRAAVNLAWSYAKFGSMGVDMVDETVVSAAALAVDCVRELNMQELSNIAWACAKQSLSDRRVFASLERAALQRLEDFKPQELANFAWAFATSTLGSRELFDAIEKESVRNLDDFKPQELANLVWSYAKAQVLAEVLFKAAVHRIDESVSGFTSQNLANLAWAFATLRISEPQFFSFVATQAIGRLSAFSPQELANIAWAFARTCISDDVLMRGISGSLMVNWALFNSQEVANLLWAFAALDHADSVAFQLAADTAAPLMSSCRPQELAGLIWAFARARVTSTALYTSAATETLRRLHDFDSQELSNTVWAFAKLAILHEQLLQAVAEHSAELVRGANSQELANLAWAFATLSEDATVLFRSVEAESRNQLNAYSSQALANLAWAFTHVGEDRVQQDMMLAIAKELEHRLGHATIVSQVGDLAAQQQLAQDALEIVWSLSFANVMRDDVSVMDALRNAVVCIGESVDDARTPGIGCGRMKNGLYLSDAAPVRGASTLDAISNATVSVKPLCSELNETSAEPRIILDLPDRLVVFKPPGWEIDDEFRRAAAKKTRSDDIHIQRAASMAPSAAGGGRQLSKFLSQTLPARNCPIITDSSHNCGFLHRIDVPSSGLVIVAKTYAGFYDLQFQQRVGDLSRDYIVMCHGWLTPSCRRICARVSADLSPSKQLDAHISMDDDDIADGHGHVGERWQAVSRRGRPAITFPKVLAHVRRVSSLDDGCSGEAFTLLAVRIGTGRLHQIRAHCAHLGHPTICDGRYSSEASFLNDRQWCPRNFLHRYMLGFTDGSGASREVVAPLPSDLISALDSGLVVRNQRSLCDGISPAAATVVAVLRNWCIYRTLAPRGSFVTRKRDVDGPMIFFLWRPI